MHYPDLLKLLNAAATVFSSVFLTAFSSVSGSKSSICFAMIFAEAAGFSAYPDDTYSYPQIVSGFE
jgi:hypothetical protein